MSRDHCHWTKSGNRSTTRTSCSSTPSTWLPLTKGSQNNRFSVKTPTLVSFNEMIECHEAGKKATNVSALVKVVKGKGRSRQETNQAKEIKFQILKERDAGKVIGKCFRCGRPDHLMHECKVIPTVKCNSWNNTGTLSTVWYKCQTAHSAQSQQPATPTESADSTPSTPWNIHLLRCLRIRGLCSHNYNNQLLPFQLYSFHISFLQYFSWKKSAQGLTKSPYIDFLLFQMSYSGKLASERFLRYRSLKIPIQISIGPIGKIDIIVFLGDFCSFLYVVGKMYSYWLCTVLCLGKNTWKHLF